MSLPFANYWSALIKYLVLMLLLRGHSKLTSFFMLVFLETHVFLWMNGFITQPHTLLWTTFCHAWMWQLPMLLCIRARKPLSLLWMLLIRPLWMCRIATFLRMWDLLLISTNLAHWCPSYVIHSTLTWLIEIAELVKLPLTMHHK